MKTEAAPIKVFCDSREMRSPVPEALDRAGADIEIKTLPVGDYVVSDRCAFERKDIDDFMNSWLIEKKLFGQIGDLARAYARPVLIVEGGNPMYAGRNVHPHATQGLLNTIAVSFRVPILYSDNAQDTANIILMIAKREQTDEKRSISVHGKRSHMNPEQKKEYVISSFPDCDIGGKKAIDLLKHFKSIRNIINASPEELREVSGIGEVIAESVRKLVTEEYK
jgi:ERCC4-type nuclease